MKITTSKFGKYSLYTIDNEKGLIVKLTNIGASITGISFKDKNKNLTEIAFGSDDYKFYENATAYMGTTTGRVAGRIIKGEFDIDGKVYKLKKNDGNNHLHGGLKGLSFRVFNHKIVKQTNTEIVIEFIYKSKSGEEGYPGNLSITCLYTVNTKNEVIINYKASTDKKTPVNITNHAYWNLNGAGNIYDQTLFIDSNYYLPVNKECLATGDILSTKNTAFDFNKAKAIGKDIKKANGYDNAFVLNNGVLKNKSVSLYSKKSGIKLDIYTDNSCVVFYSGNMLKGEKTRVGALKKHEALCLETQYMPCALNYKHFENIMLENGAEYNHTTIHKLSVE